MGASKGQIQLIIIIMNPIIIPIVVPAITFLSITLIIIFIRKYINDERMAMIEKGLTKKDFFDQTMELSLFTTLRIALLLVGAGVGLFFANILDGMFQEPVAAYFSMLLIFGGGGLVASYFMFNKRVKNRSEQPNASTQAE